MSLRTDLHSAIDQVAPSTAGMAERVVQTVLSQNGTHRRHQMMTFKLRAPLSLVAVVLVVAIVAAVLIGGRLVRDWNMFHNSTPAGDSYATQVARLEAVPLRIPTFASSSTCQPGPFNAVGSYGSGPVYGDGGGISTTGWGDYYHNLAYTETKVSGPVLTRAIDLYTRRPVVFIGPYAAGQVLGNDTVDGHLYQQRGELLMNAATAVKEPATHVLNWPFIAGVPHSWSGSTGWQIDGIGFSEVFLAC